MAEFFQCGNPFLWLAVLWFVIYGVGSPMANWPAQKSAWSKAPNTPKWSGFLSIWYWGFSGSVQWVRCGDKLVRNLLPLAQ